MAEKSHTKTWQRVVIIIIAVLFIFTSGALTIAVLFQGSTSGDEQSSQPEQCLPGPVQELAVQPAPTPPKAPIVKNIEKLHHKDLKIGSGQAVKAGDCVVILFHGTLAKNGKAFQGGDNYAEGIPYRSTTTGFVAGFAKGIVGMKAGGERQIFIPSELAYGKTARGDIPANADLVFAIKLVKIGK